MPEPFMSDNTLLAFIAAAVAVSAFVLGKIMDLLKAILAELKSRPRR